MCDFSFRTNIVVFFLTVTRYLLLFPTLLKTDQSQSAIVETE